MSTTTPLDSVDSSLVDGISSKRAIVQLAQGTLNATISNPIARPADPELAQYAWFYRPFERYISEHGSGRSYWRNTGLTSDDGIHSVVDSVLDLVRPRVQNVSSLRRAMWRQLGARSNQWENSGLLSSATSPLSREDAGLYVLMGYRKENPIQYGPDDTRNMYVVRVVEAYVGTSTVGGIREQYLVRENDSITFSVPPVPPEVGPRVFMWYRVSPPLIDQRAKALDRLNADLDVLQKQMTYTDEARSRSWLLADGRSLTYLSMVLLGYDPVPRVDSANQNLYHIEWAAPPAPVSKYANWENVFRRVHHVSDDILIPVLPTRADGVRNMHCLALLDLLAQYTEHREVETLYTDIHRFELDRADLDMDQGVYVCLEMHGGAYDGRVTLADSETRDALAVIGSETLRVAGLFEVYVLPVAIDGVTRPHFSPRRISKRILFNQISWRIDNEDVIKAEEERLPAQIMASYHPVVPGPTYSALTMPGGPFQERELPAEEREAPEGVSVVGRLRDPAPPILSDNDKFDYRSRVGDRYVRVQLHDVNLGHLGDDETTQFTLVTRHPAYAPAAVCDSPDAPFYWSVCEVRPEISEQMRDRFVYSQMSVDEMIGAFNLKNASGQPPLATSTRVDIDSRSVRVKFTATSQQLFRGDNRWTGSEDRYIIVLGFNQPMLSPNLNKAALDGLFQYVPVTSADTDSLYAVRGNETSPILGESAGKLRLLQVAMFVRLRKQPLRLSKQAVIRMQMQRQRGGDLLSFDKDLALDSTPDLKALVGISVNPPRVPGDPNFRLKPTSFLDEMRAHLHLYAPIIRQVYENRLRAADYVAHQMRVHGSVSEEQFAAALLSVSDNQELAKRFQIYRLLGSDDALWILTPYDKLPPNAGDWDDVLNVDDVKAIWPSFYEENVRLFRSERLMNTVQDMPGLDARGVRWLVRQYRAYRDPAKRIPSTDSLKVARAFLVDSANIATASRLYAMVKQQLAQEALEKRATAPAVSGLELDVTVSTKQPLDQFLLNDPWLRRELTGRVSRGEFAPTDTILQVPLLQVGEWLSHSVAYRDPIENRISYLNGYDTMSPALKPIVPLVFDRVPPSPTEDTSARQMAEARLRIGCEILVILQRYELAREQLRAAAFTGPQNAHPVSLIGSAECNLQKELSPNFYQLSASVVRLQSAVLHSQYRTSPLDSIRLPALFVTKPTIVPPQRFSKDQTAFSDDGNDRIVPSDQLIETLITQPKWAIQTIDEASHNPLLNDARYYDEMSTTYEQALGFGHRAVINYITSIDRDTLPVYYNLTLAYRIVDGKAVRSTLENAYGDTIRNLGPTVFNTLPPQQQGAMVARGLVPPSAVGAANAAAVQQTLAGHAAAQQAALANAIQQVVAALTVHSLWKLPKWVETAYDPSRSPTELRHALDQSLGDVYDANFVGDYLGRINVEQHAAHHQALLQWFDEKLFEDMLPSSGAVDVASRAKYERLTRLALCIEEMHLILFAENGAKLKEIYSSRQLDKGRSRPVTSFPDLVNRVTRLEHTGSNRQIKNAATTLHRDQINLLTADSDAISVDAIIVAKRESVVTEKQVREVEERLRVYKQKIAEYDARLAALEREDRADRALSGQQDAAYQEIFREAGLSYRHSITIGAEDGKEIVKLVKERFETLSTAEQTAKTTCDNEIARLDTVKSAANGERPPVVRDPVAWLAADSAQRQYRYLSLLISNQIARFRQRIARHAVSQFESGGNLLAAKNLIDSRPLPTATDLVDQVSIDGKAIFKSITEIPVGSLENRRIAQLTNTAARTSKSTADPVQKALFESFGRTRASIVTPEDGPYSVPPVEYPKEYETKLDELCRALVALKSRVTNTTLAIDAGTMPVAPNGRPLSNGKQVVASVKPQLKKLLFG